MGMKWQWAYDGSLDYMTSSNKGYLDLDVHEAKIQICVFIFNATYWSISEKLPLMLSLPPSIIGLLVIYWIIQIIFILYTLIIRS
jgi:hypothetical protein